MITIIVTVPQAMDSIVFVTYWPGAIAMRIGAIKDRIMASRILQIPPAIPQGLAILLRVFIFHLYLYNRLGSLSSEITISYIAITLEPQENT